MRWSERPNLRRSSPLLGNSEVARTRFPDLLQLTLRKPKDGDTSLQGETGTVGHVSAEDIAAFVDRTISPARNRKVVKHLADCAECRKAVGETAISQSFVNDPPA